MSDAAGVPNLGSGRRKMAGAVNLDISGQVGADVVHDLTVMPWPLAYEQRWAWILPAWFLSVDLEVVK